MKFVLLSLLLIISHRSYAVSICSDLAAHTCAKGEPSDGTGKTKLIDPLGFVNAEIARIRPRLVSDFKFLISGTYGAELRALAIQAYNFEDENACKPPNNNRNCISLIVDRMIESYKLKEFGPEVMSDASFFSGDSFATGKLMIDERYLSVVSRIAEEQKSLVPSALLTKVEKEIFPKTKELLKSRIRSMSIKPAEKTRMLEKIEATKYDGSDCSEVTDTTGIAPAFLPNAFYNPAKNSFKFCLGYFRASDSEFNIVHTIAHELSHSIDPCQFSDGSSIAPFTQRKSNAEVEDTYLRKNFLSCLRSKHSVGAKHLRDDTPMPISSTESLVYNDTQRLCGGDELIEAVPDWFAAEVLADYSESYFEKLTKKQKQRGFSNTLRATCRETRNDGSQHPKSRDRINGLLLVHPKIRAQMGCIGDAPKRYCDIDNLESLKAKPLKSGFKETNNKAVK